MQCDECRSCYFRYILHNAITSMNYVRLCNSCDRGNREMIFTLILNLNTSLCNFIYSSFLLQKQLFHLKELEKISTSFLLIYFKKNKVNAFNYFKKVTFLPYLFLMLLFHVNF